MRNVLKLPNFPMRGDTAEPLNSTIFHGHGQIETFGDGVGDEGGAFFLQESDELFFGGDEIVDLLCFVVEETADGLLFGEGRNYGFNIEKVIFPNRPVVCR